MEALGGILLSFAVFPNFLDHLDQVELPLYK